MKSFRLYKVLENQLNEAARITGEPVSVIIRQAIEERCKHILQQRLDARLADVTGIVCSQGGRTRNTDKTFVESLKSRQNLKQ